jgi:hypothetical protein
LLIVAEDAVLNQFRVQAAVVAVIDLLGHQAVERRADLMAGMIDFDGQLAVGGVSPARPSGGRQKNNGKRDADFHAASPVGLQWGVSI